MILHRNIHLTLTLKSLCMIRLKGNDEVLINNRHRTFPATYGSLSIIDIFLRHLLLIYSWINLSRSTSGEYFWAISSYGLGRLVATFWKIDAHSVYRSFSLYIDLL